MHGEIALQLLGGPQASSDGQPVADFAYRKATALLSYLALTGRPHSREHLAGLLWGDMTDARARANLRKVIADLKPLLGPLLLITRQAIGLDESLPFWLDVRVFEAELRDVNSLAGQQGLSEEGAVRLARAADLYRGDFLEGFHVRAAVEFEEWVLAERERLRQLALHALHMLVTHCTAQGAFAAGIDYATRLLRLEPWQEEAHYQLMLLLARSGQPTAAMRHYDKGRRILSQELGVPPSADMIALYDQICNGDLNPERLARVRVNGFDGGKQGSAPAIVLALNSPEVSLPAPQTSFVGREADLTILCDRLGDANHRLITVTGPRGIGKTRLALEAVTRRISAFGDGACFVSLAGVDSAAGAMTVVAQALGLGIADGQETGPILINHLRRKQMLLVLDGLAMAGPTCLIILGMLRSAPGVSILATARHALRILSEYEVPLHGLDNVARNQNASRAGNDAVRLFADRASRSRVGFSLSPANMRDVMLICRLLQGVPQAIELAAAWAGTMSTSEIVSTLEDQSDCLSLFFGDLVPQTADIKMPG